MKQDLSKTNSSQNIVPKVPKITKYDKSIDDTYHYLVTIETTTESSRENFQDFTSSMQQNANYHC